MLFSYLHFSQETCDENLNITMCPLCDGVCDYWRLSSVCSLARTSYLFDNGATVLFAIFMSLWGNYKIKYIFLIMLEQILFKQTTSKTKTPYLFIITKDKHSKDNTVWAQDKTNRRKTGFV